MNDGMRHTVIGRAAGVDGEGVQLKVANLTTESAIQVKLQMDEKLRGLFRQAFDDEPAEVMAERFPYIDYEDGPEEGE